MKPILPPDHFQERIRQLLRWFKPGLRVKRWLVLIFLGLTLLSVGFAMFLLDLYRTEWGNHFILTVL
jgi:hypothetical protein